MINKKILIFTAMLSILCLGAVSSEADFSKALKNCTPFSDSGQVQTAGMNVQSTKRIVGWQGDKCVYKESVKFMDISSDIYCRLSKAQILELSSVIDAYSLVQKYSDSKPDFSDLESAQNNPVSKAWSKYLQDNSVCTITTNQN